MNMMNGREELIYEERFMEYVVQLNGGQKDNVIQLGNGDNTYLHI